MSLSHSSSSIPTCVSSRCSSGLGVSAVCVCARESVCGGTHYVSTRLCPFCWWNNVFPPPPGNLYSQLPVMELWSDLIPRTILTPAGSDEQRYLWQRRIDIYSANRDLTVSGIFFPGPCVNKNQPQRQRSLHPGLIPG